MSATLSIDISKCVGCRTCEVICSLTHSKGQIEPRRSSVHIYREDTENLVLVPVVRGAEKNVEYTVGPDAAVVNRMNSHPASGLARECNLCGMCAQWCAPGAITFRRA